MKKIFLIIVIIISILLISIGIYLNVSKDSEEVLEDNYDLNELGRVITCYNEECTNQITDVYAKMTYDYDSEKLQSVIEKINRETEQNYKKATTSNTSDPTCSHISGFAKNSIRYSNEYHLYKIENLITIAVKRDKQNICTFTGESYPMESYFFDTTQNDFITHEEAKKQLGYTTENINKSITEGIKAIVKEMNLTVSPKEEYRDLTIYYTTAGDPYVSFYFDELEYHYSVPLIKE